MKKQWFIYPVFLILAVGAAVAYTEITRNKTGYIEIATVYDNFKMKQELEKQLEKIQNERKNILDSARFVLEGLKRRYEAVNGEEKNNIAARWNAKSEELQYKERQFEEDNQRLVGEYQRQITTQMSQYVKDFGKENNYKVIYGASGEGTLMYADDEYNITEEVKNYINARYEGKK